MNAGGPRDPRARWPRGAGGGPGGLADFPGLVRTPPPAPDAAAPTELPDGVTERIVVMVAVLTHSTPAQIRVALAPSPGYGGVGVGWTATAVHAGADVATGTGRKPEEALVALEQRVAHDATAQRDALVDMLDAWTARIQKPVAYESDE